MYAAPLNGADYYTGKTETSVLFRASYRIKHFSTIVKVSNKNNFWLDLPQINLSTNKAADWSYEQDPFALVYADENDIKKLVNSVFSQEQIEEFTMSDCRMRITMAVDPHTGRILEVCFYLLYTETDKTILKIPASKLYQLEKAIKNSIRCDIPDSSSNYSYLVAGGTAFYKQSSH